MVVNLDDDRQNKISFKNILIISLIFLTALGVVVGTQFLPKKTTYKSKASEISVNQNSIVDWGNAGYFYGGGYVKTNNSYNIGNVGKPMSFEGITRDLKGIMITDYFWDFGDGFKTGGTLMNTTFKKKGEYMVKLGLLAEKDSLRVIPKICVMKKIIIN